MGQPTCEKTSPLGKKSFVAFSSVSGSNHLISYLKWLLHLDYLNQATVIFRLAEQETSLYSTAPNVC